MAQHNRCRHGSRKIHSVFLAAALLLGLCLPTTHAYAEDEKTLSVTDAQGQVITRQESQLMTACTGSDKTPAVSFVTELSWEDLIREIPDPTARNTHSAQEEESTAEVITGTDLSLHSFAGVFSSRDCGLTLLCTEAPEEETAAQISSYGFDVLTDALPEELSPVSVTDDNWQELIDYLKLIVSEGEHLVLRLGSTDCLSTDHLGALLDAALSTEGLVVQTLSAADAIRKGGDYTGLQSLCLGKSSEIVALRSGNLYIDAFNGSKIYTPQGSCFRLLVRENSLYLQVCCLEENLAFQCVTAELPQADTEEASADSKASVQDSSSNAEDSLSNEAAVDAAVDGKIQLAGRRLTVDEGVHLTYALSLSDLSDTLRSSLSVSFTLMQSQSQVVEQSISLSQAGQELQDGTTLFLFDSPEIPVEAFGCTLRISVTARSENGELRLLSLEDSVLDCCRELASREESSAEEKSFAAALLQRGAQAQLFQSFDTDHLVDDNANSATGFRAPASVKKLMKYSSVAGTAFTGCGVRFGSRDCLYVRFQAGDDFRITLDDVDMTDEVISADGMYTLYSPMLSFLQGDQAMVFRLYSGGILVQSFTYSFDSFVASSWRCTTAAGETTIGALARSSYLLNAAARDLADAGFVRDGVITTQWIEKS